jgi:hypothetical protein
LYTLYTLYILNALSLPLLRQVWFGGPEQVTVQTLQRPAAVHA